MSVLWDCEADERAERHRPAPRVAPAPPAATPGPVEDDEAEFLGPLLTLFLAALLLVPLFWAARVFVHFYAIQCPW